jgi:protein phosphatase
MAEAGSVSERDVPQYVPKNVITRSLGPHENVSVDREGPYPVLPGDTFLLCSDGLTGPVPDREIGTILGCLPPEQSAQTLVDLANLRGGPDNITCLVVRANEEFSSRTAEAELPAERTEEDKLPPPPPPVHPAVWGMIAASAPAALFCAVMRYWWGVAISGVLLVIGVALALVGRLAQPGSKERGEPALGRGPYRSYDCSPDDDAVASLSTLVAELRIVALENGWEIQWDEIDTLIRSAHQARKAGDYQASVAQHAIAVRLLMQQIRGQRRHPLSDSRFTF